VGKRADLLMIGTRALNMTPVRDPAVALVHSAQPANVDTVMVDGRILKRHGRLTTIDSTAVIEQADIRLADLCRRAGYRPATSELEGSQR